MKNKVFTSKVLSLSFVALLSACKVQFDVPIGGTVRVFDFDVIYDFCPEDSRCTFDVDDYSTVRTFIAEPNDGYVFVEWAKGDRHLFGGETGYVTVDSSEALGDPKLEQLIGSDETFYLRPVFALEGYDTNPIGVPGLYQIDCNDCEGPMSLEWPASISYQRDLKLWGSGGYAEDHIVLGTFVLYANEYDYKIEKLHAMDQNDEGIAAISGLHEGQVIRKGEQVIFRLVTNAPAPEVGMGPITFEFGFGIAGTTAKFDAAVISIVGDRCPLC